MRYDFDSVHECAVVLNAVSTHVHKLITRKPTVALNHLYVVVICVEPSVLVRLINTLYVYNRMFALNTHIYRLVCHSLA
jgi:hypothetical protein